MVGSSGAMRRRHVATRLLGAGRGCGRGEGVRHVGCRYVEGVRRGRGITGVAPLFLDLPDPVSASVAILQSRLTSPTDDARLLRSAFRRAAV